MITVSQAAAMNPEQLAELKRLKAYFPYRIIYGAIKGEEFQASAVTSKRIPNQLAREGWAVWLRHFQ